MSPGLSSGRSLLVISWFIADSGCAPRVVLHPRWYDAAFAAGMCPTTNRLGLAGASPDTPGDVDPVLAGFGGSTGVFGVVRSWMPFAHGYALEERCHDAARSAAERAYGDSACPCLGADAFVSQTALDACAAELPRVLAGLPRFPEGTPCVLPEANEVDRAHGRAARLGAPGP